MQEKGAETVAASDMCSTSLARTHMNIHRALL